MQTKPTATPWQANFGRFDGNVTHFHITANEHGSISSIAEGAINKHRNSEETEANAEFIIRACNAHDDLVAACKEALECATTPVPFSKQAAKSQRVIKMLSDALTKAGESL